MYAVVPGCEVILGAQLAPPTPISSPPVASVYHLHVYPSFGVIVGSVALQLVWRLYIVHVSVSLLILWTFSPFVYVTDKTLENSAYTVVSFVTVILDSPVVASLLVFHPTNVHPGFDAVLFKFTVVPASTYSLCVCEDVPPL